MICCCTPLVLGSGRQSWRVNTLTSCMWEERKLCISALGTTDREGGGGDKNERERMRKGLRNGIKDKKGEKKV